MSMPYGSRIFRPRNIPMSEFGTVAWTLGSGDRTLADFLDLPASVNMETVSDIRPFPATGHESQLTKDALGEVPVSQGIEYRLTGDQFGGHRPEFEDSPNIGLQKTMRGIADHVATEAFKPVVADSSIFAGPADSSWSMNTKKLSNAIQSSPQITCIPLRD